MTDKTRGYIVITILLLLALVIPVVAECIPLLIITVLTAGILYLVAAYAPEYKEKKTT